MRLKVLGEPLDVIQPSPPDGSLTRCSLQTCQAALARRERLSFFASAFGSKHSASGDTINSEQALPLTRHAAVMAKSIKRPKCRQGCSTQSPVFFGEND
jgi:hypothetical protein